jgi:hypothetical protein
MIIVALKQMAKQTLSWRTDFLIEGFLTRLAEYRIFKNPGSVFHGIVWHGIAYALGMRCPRQKSCFINTPGSIKLI